MALFLVAGGKPYLRSHSGHLLESIVQGRSAGETAGLSHFGLGRVVMVDEVSLRIVDSQRVDKVGERHVVRIVDKP